MDFLKDPKIFNYIILILYILCAVRWAFEKNYGQFIYWVGAIILTYAITFLIKS